jgi:hypothetical protein
MAVRIMMYSGYYFYRFSMCNCRDEGNCGLHLMVEQMIGELSMSHGYSLQKRRTCGPQHVYAHFSFSVVVQPKHQWCI